jgi:hypothetical protein
VGQWPTISTELQELFKVEELRRTRPTANLNSIITRHFRTLDVVMSALYGIRYYLYLPQPTPEDQEQFKALAINFGKLWRQGLHLPVPPKLHLLESHCGSQLEELGTIGLFLEETMESAHRDDNTMNRMFSNIRDWETREKAKVRRSQRESNTEVQQQVSQLQGAKRVFSDAKLQNPSLLQGPEGSSVSGLVTVKLVMYEESCGYTKEVSFELYSRKNRANRDLLERAGIQFEASTQSYDKKKITLSKCASNRSYFPWSELYEQQSTPSTRYSQSSESQSSESQSSQSQSSQYSGIRLFSPPSRNGRHMTFYRIPKSISAEQSKENFLRNVPQAVFVAVTVSSVPGHICPLHIP